MPRHTRRRRAVYLTPFHGQTLDHRVRGLLMPSALDTADQSRRAAAPPPRQPATSSAGHRSRTLSIAASGTALVMAVFSAFVVNVGDSVRTLHAGVAGEAWGLSGISLGLAAALLTAGALADDLGHPRVLRCSAGLLAAASAIGALAPSIEILVAARVMQGVAGGGILAAGLGSIGRTFPSGAARTHATAVWGAAVGGGVTVGPLAGAALAAATLNDSPRTARSPLDIPGITTLAAGMTLLTAALVETRHAGPPSPRSSSSARPS
jgi:MFS family permease